MTKKLTQEQAFKILLSGGIVIKAGTFGRQYNFADGLLFRKEHSSGEYWLRSGMTIKSVLLAEWEEFDEFALTLDEALLGLRNGKYLSITSRGENTYKLSADSVLQRVCGDGLRVKSTIALSTAYATKFRGNAK